jgi:hypothetical protein
VERCCCPPCTRLKRVWEIADLTITMTPGLAADWSIITGRATEAVAAVLGAIGHSLGAARKRNR